MPVRSFSDGSRPLIFASASHPCVRIGTLPSRPDCQNKAEEFWMNQLIYLVGLIVVILAILSFFGLR